MAKQYWRPGNMLYPVPAVMVSCGLPDEKPNIITIAWACLLYTSRKNINKMRKIFKS